MVKTKAKTRFLRIVIPALIPSHEQVTDQLLLRVRLVPGSSSPYVDVFLSKGGV